MLTMKARLVRLERGLCPEHERSDWCCALTDPEDTHALPPTCPHGGRWLVIEAVPPQPWAGLTDDGDAQARYDACHPGALDRSFTIRIDRAYGGEEVGDA